MQRTLTHCSLGLKHLRKVPSINARPHQRVIRVRQADVHSKLPRHPGDIPMEPDGVESQSVREGGDHVLNGAVDKAG